MSKAPNLHSSFFSSIRQVEKRLKLETPSPSLNLSPPSRPTDKTPTESLCSPIFLEFDHDNHQHGKYSATLESCETPSEFLSKSNDFSPTHVNPLSKSAAHLPEIGNPLERNDIDEIELLTQLLELSDCEHGDSNLGLKICSSCRCEGGFYDRIVEFKGPKCEKEMERLEGWIKHFRGEEIEPLRMVHMLLGKAAFLSRDSEGFEGFEFPSTVEEFLQNDPPSLVMNDD